MKTNVEELAPYADQTTLQLLNFVIDKKRKFDEAKKRQLELVLAWFCLTILYTVYVVKTLLLPYRYSFLDLFNQLMTNQLSTFGLLAILFCLFAFKLLKEQKEKRKKSIMI
nr:DUF2663 family protein [Bacillus coahuilensis]